MNAAHFSRRSFLLGTVALAVASSAPAWADAGPTKPTILMGKIRTRIADRLRAANAAGRAPVKPAATVEAYKAAYKNIAEKANTRAAARLSAQIAEAAVPAAESRMMWGLVGGMARLGATTVKGLNLVGIGLTLLYVGSELYHWIFGSDLSQTDLGTCPIQTICRVTKDGKKYITTTTYEYSTATSNWSLSKYWYAQAYTGVYDANSRFKYYIVKWVWQEHDGWTANNFDPKLEYSPYVRGIGQTALKEQLQNSGMLDKPLTRADLAAITDAIEKGMVAADPSLYPAEWSNGATVADGGRPEVKADEFTDYDESSKLSDLFDLWPSNQSGTDPFQLIDPDAFADRAVTDPATGTPSVPGSTPTPTPTPTPTGTSTCAPGSAGCPAKVDWGDPPQDDPWPTINPTSWFPNPFQAPVLSGSCSPFDFGSVNGSPIVVNTCPSLATMSGTVRPLCAVGATVYAGKVLLDL